MALRCTLVPHNGRDLIRSAISRLHCEPAKKKKSGPWRPRAGSLRANLEPSQTAERHRTQDIPSTWHSLTQLSDRVERVRNLLFEGNCGPRRIALYGSCKLYTNVSTRCGKEQILGNQTTKYWLSLLNTLNMCSCGVPIDSNRRDNVDSLKSTRVFPAVTSRNVRVVHHWHALGGIDSGPAS